MATPRARLHHSLGSLISSPLQALITAKSRDEVEGHFLREFKEVCQLESHQVALIASCRISLYLLLRSMELPPKSLIAVTPITIPDMVNSILLAGHTPYFLELDEDNHNIEAKEISELSNKGVKVAVLAHLSGIFDQKVVAHIKELQRQDIFVIEDISQAYASITDHFVAGAQGDAFIGSLCLGKIISALGGGVLGTKDPQLFHRVQTLAHELAANKLTPIKSLGRYLWQHFKVSLLTTPLLFSFFTIWALRLASRFRSTDEIFRSKKRLENYPYDNPSVQRTHYPSSFFTKPRKTQIILAIKCLRELNARKAKRNSLRKIYQTQLHISSALPSALVNEEANTLWHYPVHLQGRNYQEVQSKLLQEGIDTCGYLLRNCNELACFAPYHRDLPKCHQISKETIFIPIHESLSEREARLCATAFNDLF